jgi:hypothetical protein
VRAFCRYREAGTLLGVPVNPFGFEQSLPLGQRRLQTTAGRWQTTEVPHDALRVNIMFEYVLALPCCGSDLG